MLYFTSFELLFGTVNPNKTEEKPIVVNKAINIVRPAYIADSSTVLSWKYGCKDWTNPDRFNTISEMNATIKFAITKYKVNLSINLSIYVSIEN